MARSEGCPKFCLGFCFRTQSPRSPHLSRLRLSNHIPVLHLPSTPPFTNYSRKCFHPSGKRRQLNPSADDRVIPLSQSETYKGPRSYCASDATGGIMSFSFESSTLLYLCFSDHRKWRTPRWTQVDVLCLWAGRCGTDGTEGDRGPHPAPGGWRQQAWPQPASWKAADRVRGSTGQSLRSAFCGKGQAGPGNGAGLGYPNASVGLWPLGVAPGPGGAQVRWRRSGTPQASPLLFLEIESLRRCGLSKRGRFLTVKTMRFTEKIHTCVCIDSYKDINI